MNSVNVPSNKRPIFASFVACFVLIAALGNELVSAPHSTNIDGATSSKPKVLMVKI